MNRIFSFILLLIAVSMPANASILALPQEKNISIKSSFTGKWKMKTIVTSSSCPDILVGSTTESKLIIGPAIKGPSNHIKALWKGGDWKQSNGVLKLLNDKEAITERITKIKTKKHEEWEAVLIDHLNLDEKNTIHTESIVIQYKNGEIVGEYKTYSILTRVK
jgi:hypothetical protein